MRIVKDYDKKIKDIDNRIDDFGKVVIENIKNLVYLSCLKHKFVMENTTEILEKSYQSLVDKYGEDWVDSRIGKKDD